MAGTMRAWTFTRRGLPSDILTLTPNHPKPLASSLTPNEVLIKVSHVTLFQGFAAIMGIVPHMTSNPWIPCCDFSGVVEATGADVRNVSVGDCVFGTPDPKSYIGSKNNGSLAEYVVLPAGLVARVDVPSGEEREKVLMGVAGLAGNGCTAVQFAVATRMRRGQRVLVTGASGGLGSIVVQVVRGVVGDEGTIVGTCSAANEALVKGLGVDEVVDYRTHSPLPKYLASTYASNLFDVIIDTIGADDTLFAKCPAYLQPDGVFLWGGKNSLIHGGGGVLDILSFLVRIRVQTLWPLFLGGTPRQGLFHSGSIDDQTMPKVGELVAQGTLKGVVDSVWEMEDVLKAYERVATGRVRGKVVVHVQDV